MYLLFQIILGVIAMNNFNIIVTFGSLDLIPIFNLYFYLLIILLFMFIFLMNLFKKNKTINQLNN